MTADIVVTRPSSRTYSVPAVIVDTILASGVTDALSSRLAEERKATQEDVIAIHTKPENPGHGSNFGKAWAAKIVQGLIKDELRDRQQQLDRFGYNDSRYLYWGLTSTEDDDFVHTVGRSPVNDTTLDNAETLTASGTWKPYEQSKSTDRRYGVALEPELFAFVASAITEGCQGVYLCYGEPHCFLEQQPLLAAGVPTKMETARDSHVYAIVDSTDTTAVMDVILLKPGPEAYRRDGGSWVLDNATLDALLSAAPPPIVELTGDTLSSVLEQVDMGQANQVSPNDDGSAEKGEMLENPMQPVERSTTQKSATSATTKTQERKIQPPKHTPSDTPSRDTYQTNQNKSQIKTGQAGHGMSASLRTRHETSTSLTALVASMDIEQLADTLRTDLEIRGQSLKSAVALIEYTKGRIHDANHILLPALVADAVSVHDKTPNQRKARHLRKYWVRGKGAVKIRWGTPGDFRRCVRQLRKYLGSRTEGYCAKRHKETVGYWPGDKKNTGPKKGATGQKNFD